MLHKGDSDYRSMNVYVGIESMKAQLLEVFSGNTRPVVFNTAPGETDMQAKFRTDYVTRVIFSQNPGFQVFQTVIEDALKARNGVCKVYWETAYEDQFYELSEPSYEQLMAFLLKDPTSSVEEVEKGDEEGVLKRVRVKCKRNRSQVRLRPIPPEEFGISQMATSIEEANLVFHRQTMTRSELIKHGYAREVVDALPDSDGMEARLNPEVVQRFDQTGDVIGLADRDGDTQEAQRIYTVYECYMHLDIEGDGTSQLYKVDLCCNKVLDKEPVNTKPFIDFCALPRSHAFYGTNYGLLLVPTQNAQTFLTRSIINHSLITTNPRMMVAQGGVTNPRELMENRLGGIVNVRDVMSSVAPLPQASLNPFVFQTMSQLQQGGEEISGISSLSQGLNKDAISTQNSQGMVQDLIAVSQIRQKIIARNFAEVFLRKLYSMVYRLILENEEPQKLIQESNGVWKQTDFTQWPEDTEMEISLALGYGEQAKEAQKWQTIDQYLSNPANGYGPAYTPDKKFYVASRILENMGIKDATSVILPPDQIQPPQPDPLQQAELAVKQADAQVKLANAEAAKLNAQLAREEAQQKYEQGMAKIHLQTEKAHMEQALKRDQLDHKIDIDTAELLMSREALEMGAAQARIEPG
uniref:portal protein n=1 Tax=Asaia prunellae TaxID=610245 RepID=UPI00131F2CD1|nr:hypothetical protein [Asaia prunellae]